MFAGIVFMGLYAMNMMVSPGLTNFLLHAEIDPSPQWHGVV